MSNAEPAPFTGFCGKRLQSHHQLCLEAALTTTATCFDFQTQDTGLQAAGSWLEKTNPWHLQQPAQTTPPALSIFRSNINTPGVFFPPCWDRGFQYLSAGHIQQVLVPVMAQLCPEKQQGLKAALRKRPGLARNGRCFTRAWRDRARGEWL